MIFEQIFDVVFYNDFFDFAAGFCIVAIILYSVLFATDLSDNILTRCNLQNGWSSKDQAHLGFSFYFLVVATVFFLSNIVVMIVAGIQCKQSKSFRATMTAKAIDGTMMFWKAPLRRLQFNPVFFPKFEQYWKHYFVSRLIHQWSLVIFIHEQL